MCSEHTQGIEMPRRFGVELEGYVNEDVYGSVRRANGYVWDVVEDGSLTDNDDDEQCDDCDGYGHNSCDNCDSDGEVRCDCDHGHVPCDECEGACVVEEDGEEVTCANCSGDGYQNCDECEGSGYIKCGDCDGTNRVECSTCEGEGRVDTEGNSYGIEAKSEPLLHSGPVYDMYEYLDNIGWHIDNTAGLHIHVEVGDYEWHDFQKLIALVVGMEPFIFSVTSSFRYDCSSYCDSLESYYTGVARVLKAKPESLEGIRDLYYTNRRYMGLNLHAYRDFRKTVEFRYFSPQDDAVMVEAYADLVTRIVNFAKYATYEQVLVITKKLIGISSFEQARNIISEVLDLQKAEHLIHCANVYKHYDPMSIEQLLGISTEHSIAI
ncbi:amidoligase family protein [Paenibacillus xylanexedens]|uniref:amidoligase family protein n=1 Tax=Paenibacillus xylanexedens TaxID=528191 RepID=UPI000F530FC5|nr:amidoligase family protein [Paenibacillus xylanexedens]RPK20126.1 hypothetical protein EDO6_06665 [Paenibacillus xylanexedens]